MFVRARLSMRGQTASNLPFGHRTTDAPSSSQSHILPFFILDVWLFTFSPEVMLSAQLFFLSLSQLELKPQGRLLMEAKYYLEKCGE